MYHSGCCWFASLVFLGVLRVFFGAGFGGVQNMWQDEKPKDTSAGVICGSLSFLQRFFWPLWYRNFAPLCLPGEVFRRPCGTLPNPAAVRLWGHGSRGVMAGGGLLLLQPRIWLQQFVATLDSWCSLLGCVWGLRPLRKGRGRSKAVGWWEMWPVSMSSWVQPRWAESRQKIRTNIQLAQKHCILGPFCETWSVRDRSKTTRKIDTAALDDALDWFDIWLQMMCQFFVRLTLPRSGIFSADLTRGSNASFHQKGLIKSFQELVHGQTLAKQKCGFLHLFAILV